MRQEPLIALISATPLAIKPAAGAIASRIPSARIWNLLDDRLLSDAQDAGGLNEALWQRMDQLIRYALDAHADGIVLTCSQFGEVARAAGEVERTVPILAADDAAFDAVADGNFRSVLILASLESALIDTTTRLSKTLDRLSVGTELIGRVVPGASDAAARASVDELSTLLRDAVMAAPAADAVLLAQYSLAIAQQALAERIEVPVLAGPSLSAQRLAEELGRR